MHVNVLSALSPDPNEVKPKSPKIVPVATPPSLSILVHLPTVLSPIFNASFFKSVMLMFSPTPVVNWVWLLPYCTVS